MILKSINIKFRAINTKILPSILKFTLLFTLVSSVVIADVSVNVPIHHWSYDAIERLAMAGLVSSAGLNTKPLTRMQMARLVAESVKKIDNEEVNPFSIKPSIEYTLVKLIKEYRRELIRLGLSIANIDDSQPRKLRFRIIESLKAQQIITDLYQEGRQTLENRRGLQVDDRYNIHVEHRGWAEVQNLVAGSVTHTFRYNSQNNQNEYVLLEGVGKLQLWNIEIEGGRDSMWWGPGYHGALVMTDNAFPLHMAKICNDKPYRIPFIPFRWIGYMKTTIFLAQLEAERTIPEPYLGGLRFEITPHPRINIGFNRLFMLAGKGRPKLGIDDIWTILSGEAANEERRTETNQLAGADIDIRFRDFKIYGEFYGEDETSFARGIRIRFPKSRSYLVGILLDEPFKLPNTNFRLEFAETHSFAYGHFIYTTGYTHKGDYIGHHMGGGCRDLFIRYGFMPSDTTEAGVYYDRQSMKSSGPNQTKNEIGFDINFIVSEHMNVKVLYEYEDYDNFGSVSTESRNNHIIEVHGELRY